MPEPHAISPRYRRIAVLMLLAAVSLGVEATLHVSGTVRYNGGNETTAGYSEAVIVAVLLFGTFRLARRGSTGHTAALVATVFAIAGFILGLTYTVPSGQG